jgi:hypothetical protein
MTTTTDPTLASKDIRTNFISVLALHDVSLRVLKIELSFGRDADNSDGSLPAMFPWVTWLSFSDHAAPIGGFRRYSTCVVTHLGLRWRRIRRFNK